MRQTTGFARLCPAVGWGTYRLCGNGERPGGGAAGVAGFQCGRRLAFDPLRRFVEGLAAGRTVVRYDRLGTGLSDRERPRETLTPEFEDATLCAVLGELGLERVALMGISCGTCIAVSFATRWPKRVDRLVLYGSYANGHALGPPEARTGMVGLVRSHWGLGSRLLTDVFGPSWSARDRAAFTASQRAAADAEVAADLLTLIYETDVREELPRVRAPALGCIVSTTTGLDRGDGRHRRRAHARRHVVRHRGSQSGDWAVGGQPLTTEAVRALARGEVSLPV